MEPKPNPDPMMGRVLKDTFTIEEQIGAGGMGTVYRAVQQPLGRSVAVKVLSPVMGSQPDLVKRFYREAKLLSELAHPHIVGIIDFGSTSDGLIYMVMEFLKGKELEEVIGPKGMPAGRVREVFGQICSGVGVAHTQELIHRDLKPANVFLARVSGDQEVVKILDFGIAKAMGEEKVELTQAGYMMGTPGYISPEQIEDSAAADHRCDIYALGSMLYFMLTGQKPYPGKTPHAIMSRQLGDPPNLIDFTSVGLPASLDSVIRKAMALEPEDRYQTTKELLDDFDAALAGMQLSAPGMPTQLPSMAGQGDPALMPTLQQPSAVAGGSTMPPAMTGSGPMPTAFQTQMAAPADRRFVVAVVLLVALVFGGGAAGLVATGVIGGSSSGVTKDMVVDAREAAVRIRDELSGRKKKAEAAVKEAVDKVKSKQAAYDAATGDARATAERELNAARQELVFQRGLVALGDKMVFGGSEWDAAGSVLKRAENRAGEGALDEAKKQYEAAKVKLTELRVRVEKVEGVQRARAGAVIAMRRWEKRRDAAGVAETAVALAAAAVKNAEEFALSKAFEKARAQYERGEQLYEKAIAAADEELKKKRESAIEFRAKAEKERQAILGLVGEGQPPTGLAVADKTRDAAAAAFAEGKLADASVQYGSAAKMYGALLATLRKNSAEARTAAEKTRKKAEGKLAEIDKILAPGELKAPDSLKQARAGVERGRKATAAANYVGADKEYGAAIAVLDKVRAELEAVLAADLAGVAKARGRWQGIKTTSEDALTLATDALKRERDQILARGATADKASKAARHREARKGFEKARDELRSWTGRVFFERGLALQEDEDHEKSEPLFRKAVAVDPGELRYQVKLGQSLYGQEKYEDALKVLTPVAAKAPKNRDAHMQIGLCHSASNRLPQAAAAFRKAVALDEDYWESNYYLGVVLAQSSKQSRRDEARKLLRRAKKNAPKSKHKLIDQSLIPLGG